MSRHTVKLHGVVIGYSDLEEIEPSLGRARGRFRPGTGYELVQPVFRLYAEAVPAPGAPVTDQAKLDRYHRSRDALGLQLEDDAGRPIRTNTIHISDYTEAADAGARGLELEVLIPDRAYWARRADA